MIHCVCALGTVWEGNVACHGAGGCLQVKQVFCSTFAALKKAVKLGNQNVTGLPRTFGTCPLRKLDSKMARRCRMSRDSRRQSLRPVDPIVYRKIYHAKHTSPTPTNAQKKYSVIPLPFHDRQCGMFLDVCYRRHNAKDRETRSALLSPLI